MTPFTLHNQNTASDAAKPLLAKSQQAYGMIPGLHAVMAEAPGLLEGYQVLHGLFVDSSFTADEKTVVWQTINVEHACHYCVPAHTGIAKSMKVADDISNALRDETPLPTAKLEALRDFTLAMVRQRGELEPKQLQDFYAAGYTQQNVLEVILGMGQKVMSNYTNHIAQTPVDEAFKQFAWDKKSSS
jgi:alkylhydroperoxidase family enzyme